MSDTDPEIVEAVEVVLEHNPEHVEDYRNGNARKSFLLGMKVENVLPNPREHHPGDVQEELMRQLEDDSESK